MPGDVTIRDRDLAEAESFLEALLASKIPEGNFSPGSHLHDIVIRAFAYVVAYIRAEAAEVASMQSLAQIQELTGYTADAVADNLLSNWFVTRKDGTRSAGVVTLVFDTTVESVVVPAGTVFTRSRGLSFVPVSDSDTVFFLGRSLLPAYSETGDISGYTAELAVEAEFAGVSSELAPGTWEAWEDFSPHLVSVRNDLPFSASTSVESTYELVERAKESLTSRDFLSARSLRATLLEDLGVVKTVTPIGAGDPEMMRDRVTGFGESETVHALGHVNVYTGLDLLPSQTYSAVIPTGGSSVDLPVGTRVVSIRSVSVERLDANLAPAGYDVDTPSRASYRLNPDSGEYTYCRGNYCAVLDESGYPVVDSEGAVSSNAATTLNLSDLEKPPVYTGLVIAAGDEGSYTVSVEDPVLFNTKLARVSLNMGTAEYPRSVAVNYVTYKGADLVDAYLGDDDRRVLTSNLLGYAHVPVNIKVNVTYLRAASSTAALPLELAQTGISSFINEFSAARSIRAGDLVSYITSTFGAYVASVSLPLLVSFYMEAPDGKALEFYSLDEITPSVDKLVVPNLYTADLMREQQVSYRTAKVVCLPEDVSVRELA